MVDRGPVVIQVKIKVAAVTTSRHGGERGGIGLGLVKWAYFSFHRSHEKPLMKIDFQWQLIFFFKNKGDTIKRSP